MTGITCKLIVHRRISNCVSAKFVVNCSPYFRLQFLNAAFFVGCSAGNSGSQASPTSSPNSPNPVALTTAALSFSNSGSQQIVVTGGTGTVSTKNTCSNIATLAAPIGGTGDGTYTVTPTGNGSCAINFTDGTTSATVSITVNLPSIAQNPLTVSQTSFTFTEDIHQSVNITGGHSSNTQPTATVTGCGNVAVMVNGGGGFNSQITGTQTIQGIPEGLWSVEPFQPARTSSAVIRRYP
jgi:hypothetical protein